MNPQTLRLFGNENTNAETQHAFCNFHPQAVRFRKRAKELDIPPPELGEDIQMKVKDGEINCLAECPHSQK